VTVCWRGEVIVPSLHWSTYNQRRRDVIARERKVVLIKDYEGM